MLIEKKAPRTQTFYLVFCEGEHVFTKYLKKGFGHVYVIKKEQLINCPNPIWTMVEPLLPWCHVQSFSSEVDFPKMLVSRGRKVIMIETYTRKRWRFLWDMPFLPCLSFVKYMCSIPGFYRSPYSLYTYLIKCIDKKPGWLKKIKIIGDDNGCTKT